MKSNLNYVVIENLIFDESYSHINCVCLMVGNLGADHCNIYLFELHVVATTSDDQLLFYFYVFIYLCQCEI
jgi:hypothetical protein